MKSRLWGLNLRDATTAPMRPGPECSRHFAWDADASTCITCPFCRASFKHIPITTEIIWEMLLKRMRVTMEIFVWWNGKDDIQDFPRFSHDVPEADKREAIEYVVQCWVDMGNEEFCPQLAVTVYIQVYNSPLPSNGVSALLTSSSKSINERNSDRTNSHEGHTAATITTFSRFGLNRRHFMR